MKAYMTNGTLDFLIKIKRKHALKLFLMKNNEGGLAYYEDNKKRIFSAGRGYEVVTQNGEIQEDGYVVMNNIPVTDDARAVFEDRFKKRRNDVESMPGFQAFRFLRPLKGNNYVVFTQWKSVRDFENWKNSSTFQKAHQDTATKNPAYYADRPFTKTFQMYVEEES
ncbi:antibiotic biosynthesis monooxygenase family protein [Oceanobacillus bengalensis]|uniref:Antibiotic biosynthesis monooxygenase n=1 Tax=Oceanobacillus bengalensis TaxID=1435466 RepID=A0A494Z897_9BACI|nr:antibiotic biosynthesis monooxygenase [Oceanobacillus bengalensis]RKQ18815.1 antibiotic biosynthesis monooxygenase [Oceanobacillus bengalensis]